jgi:hypothetical protein
MVAQITQPPPEATPRGIVAAPVRGLPTITNW